MTREEYLRGLRDIRALWGVGEDDALEQSQLFVRKVLALFPGPLPSEAQIKSASLKVAKFVEKAKAS